MERAGDVVKLFYDAVIKRDFATARKHLKGDLIFRGLFKTYYSADEYIADLNMLMQITARLNVKRIISEEDNAVIFFELETKGPVEATTLVAEYHQTREGQIAYMESAFDGRPFDAMFAASSQDS